MNEEGRHNWIFIAVVLSTAIHAGLMFFMRPQVMTHIAGSGARERARPPMVARQRPEQPESVRFEVVKDVSPERSAPKAEAEDIVPMLSGAAGITPEAPAISESAPEAVPGVSVPLITSDPSEALSQPMVSVAPEKVSPIAHGEALNAVRLAESASLSSASPLVESSVAEVVPSISVPRLEVRALPEEPSVSVKAEEPPSKPQIDFVPAKEVFKEVDAAVVEAEKSAVRDLLDVRNADELSKYVNTVATSASAGEWAYFRVRIMPRTDLKTIPKDVVILIDASGSIANDRLKSCRRHAKEILRTCMNTGDRFNIVAFRDDFSYAFKEWQAGDAAAFKRAESWLDNLAAYGRTDVFATVASVLKLPRDPKRPLIALVVTDGIANKGVSETSQILSKFTALNDGLISMYMYGVKDNANRELIDVLTKGNRGESFIYEGSRRRAGSELGQFSDRFRDPVLSDLRIVFSAASKAEAYPVLLKNLYRGDMLEVVGRVPKGTEEVAFSLKGLNGEKAYEGFFRYNLTKIPFDKNIPQEWATGKAIDAKLR